MDERTKNLIEECKRQEESCLYTSTALFEWLKSLRIWNVGFVVVPIVLAAVATAPLFTARPGYEWLIAICALLAGLAPAIYKALDYDVGLNAVVQHAHQFKGLQDRFRQSWRVTALGQPDEFKKEFDALMAQLDSARSASLTPPERYFKKAQAKIQAGDYDFSIDTNA